MTYCMILTTCSNRKEAETLATDLVTRKLAACVQLSPVTSFYVWESQSHADPEIRLVIKTRKALYDQVKRFICEAHSYDVPQILQVPVTDGLDPYLDWMDANTQSE